MWGNPTISFFTIHYLFQVTLSTGQDFSPPVLLFFFVFSGLYNGFVRVAERTCAHADCNNIGKILW